jgi:hypothetical protein
VGVRRDVQIGDNFDARHARAIKISKHGPLSAIENRISEERDG